MVSITYAAVQSLVVVFGRYSILLNVGTRTIGWMIVLFFASLAASAAYGGVACPMCSAS